MNLRTTLEAVLRLLEQHPNIESQAKLKASADKLNHALNVFKEEADLSTIQNSNDFAKLAGLLNDPTKAKVVKLPWANAHLKRLGLEELTGKSFAAPAKNLFLLRVISANGGKSIIDELTQTEEQKLQNDFARFAKLSERHVRDELDKGYKAAKLTSFCEANAVPVVPKKTKTSLVDRPATIRNIMAALESFRERQKL
jgi:hypothetical protein